MTPVQTQPHPADSATRARTVTDAMDASEPRVGDDMTVEVALSVMAGARAGHLLVCDDDGRCTGLITRTRLTAVRAGSAYTDRMQLRDVLGVHGPLSSPAATRAEAEQARRYRRLTASSVVDMHGGAPGVLALTP